VVTNDAAIAERLDKIAFPGLTANFDAAKSAALAITLLDWREFGEAYATQMRDLALSLARTLDNLGLPVFAKNNGFTTSHQFALEAHSLGGGQAAAKRLREVNLLSCGIGLPMAEVPGDVNGLRIGTPELARIGMHTDDMTELAHLIHRGLTGNDPSSVAGDVRAFRKRFTDLKFIRK
jgi:glycine hydroxymethyltransferase